MGENMSLKSVGLAAKSIGYVTWAFDGVIRLASKVGKRGYEIVSNKPKYSVEILVGDRHIELKDDITAKQVNDILKTMNTVDSISIVVRKYRI
tara:strand:+ start:273 stop:551 length:279 start_codon:yes stop_codon:yes gene_type:complete